MRDNDKSKILRKHELDKTFCGTIRMRNFLLLKYLKNGG